MTSGLTTGTAVCFTCERVGWTVLPSVAMKGSSVDQIVPVSDPSVGPRMPAAVCTTGPTVVATCSTALPPAWFVRIVVIGWGSPTAQHCVEVGQSTALRPVRFGSTTRSGRHVCPALLVSMIVPASPTAQHCTSAGHATPCRSSVVPEVCGIQVAPAFVVARIVPDDPTAQQVESSEQEIAWSDCTVPDDSALQVAPPVVEAIMVPV